MGFSSRYGLFSPANGRFSANAEPFHKLLEELDLFVEANHKSLLNKYRLNPLRKSALLAPLHGARSKGNTSRFENYLKNFIHVFDSDPELKQTTSLYKHLLSIYQKTKTVLYQLNANARQQPSNSIESLIVELKPSLNPELSWHHEWLNKFNTLIKPSETLTQEKAFHETPTFTKQQIALEQLQNTFINCIKLHIIKDNVPYHHALLLQNYYPAKLNILLHNYEKQYSQANFTGLVTTATQAIKEEQEETIRANYLDAKNELENRKSEFNEPRYQKEQNKLQQERENQLNQINNATPQLNAHATKLIALATDHNKMKPVLETAIEEVARNRITLRGGPALLNALKSGNRRNYEQTFIPPFKTDNPATMSEFAELFREQCATMTTESQAAPAA